MTRRPGFQATRHLPLGRLTRFSTDAWMMSRKLELLTLVGQECRPSPRLRMIMMPHKGCHGFSLGGGQRPRIAGGHIVLNERFQRAEGGETGDGGILSPQGRTADALAILPVANGTGSGKDLMSLRKQRCLIDGGCGGSRRAGSQSASTNDGQCCCAERNRRCWSSISHR